MVLTFSWLPPEINSARILAGAGTGSLFTAASAWDGLASDLATSASSFQSVLSSLANGSWTGPASLSMAAAAVPYVTWLQGAAAQASAAASQARVAASAFESALAATVPLPLVTSNRSTLQTLAASNYLGQNTPAIFATEFDYAEMWAQDVGAMLGYHAGATSAMSSLAPFSLPALSLPGLSGAVSSAGSVLSDAFAPVEAASAAVASGVSVGVSSVASLASTLPLSSLASVAQIGMYPASMMISPMMSLAQMANQSSLASGAGAAAALADAPKLVGAAAGDVKPLGGIGGGGMAGGLGGAHLVGAMSVPPTWQGSMPTKMASSAMSGLGPAGVPNPAAVAGGAPAGGGMPMMPMPMGGMGGGGMPGGPLGRGGASPHVTQNRPSVVPRTGVG